MMFQLTVRATDRARAARVRADRPRARRPTRVRADRPRARHRPACAPPTRVRGDRYVAVQARIRRSEDPGATLVSMPTHETALQRGARRGRSLLLRTGEELRQARMAAGLSTRRLGSLVGISHTQVTRVERGLAPHVDIDVLARMAAMLGQELALRIYPVATPVRDSAHLALLERLRRRLHPSIRWRSEVSMPLPGDLRSADATLGGRLVDALVECETRLGDAQAVQRRTAAKARDLGVRRIILLVLDSRHNREVVRSTPELRRHFPVGTRAALAALGRGEDPEGDCLIFL